MGAGDSNPGVFHSPLGPAFQPGPFSCHLKVDNDVVRVVEEGLPTQTQIFQLFQEGRLCAAPVGLEPGERDVCPVERLAGPVKGQYALSQVTLAELLDQPLEGGGQITIHG